jgi:hypothetical protein
MSTDVPEGCSLFCVDLLELFCPLVSPRSIAWLATDPHHYLPRILFVRIFYCFFAAEQQWF